MGTRFPVRLARWGWLVAAALAAGCATTTPEPTRMVNVSRGDSGPTGEYPPSGTIWRLDAEELKALGPLVRAPDPPPAPRRDSRAELEGDYLLVPSIVYYGSRFGFGWNYAPHWPYYRYGPYLPYYRPWHYRRY